MPHSLFLDHKRASRVPAFARSIPRQPEIVNEFTIIYHFDEIRANDKQTNAAREHNVLRAYLVPRSLAFVVVS